MFPNFSTVPRTKRFPRETLYSILMVIGASLFIALAAQVRLFLPFTPVPITLQTVAVMLVGVSLGSRKGALAVLAYLAEAFAGLPVLSGWHANPAFLLEPVGGYLVGFVMEAWLIGRILEIRKNISFFTILLALSIGEVVMLGLGTLWLVNFVGWSQAAPMGLLPFLPIEALKITLVASCVTICERKFKST